MTKPRPDREEIFDRAREALLARLPGIQAIYAHGSFARGDARPDSDLDVGVLLPPGRRLGDRLDLTTTVSRQIGRDVDLVNLREAGLDLVREILRDGKLLYCRDAERTLAWEAERMTAYSDFLPRRSALLDMYLREPLRTQ